MRHGGTGQRVLQKRRPEGGSGLSDWTEEPYVESWLYTGNKKSQIHWAFDGSERRAHRSGEVVVA